MTATGRARFPLFAKAFADTWRSLVGWGIGLSAAICLYLPLFPSMSGSLKMQQLIDSLPTQLTRTLNYSLISTGPGYTQSTFFGLLGFLLISIAGISWGAAAIGGDEESGQLELTLAHGVTRTEVAGQRFAALAVKILALTALVFLLVLAWNSPAKLGISIGALVGTCLSFSGLALLGASVALCCGATTGRRVWGLGGGAAVAVVGYVCNALGNQSSALAWLHVLSPYHWAFGNDPLTNGASWFTVAAFYLGCLGLGVLTALVLRRRDIGV
jgi:ABC-2 type transport system permease protein